MNSENKNELETNVITKDMVNELERTECESIGNKKKWKKKCPKCGNNQYYGLKDAWIKALKKSTLCKRCSSNSKERLRKVFESRKGYKHTEEVKRKISESNKGKVRTEELKQKLSKLNRGHLGFWKNKLRSTESKLKMSISAKGKHCDSMSETAKRNMRIAALKRLEKSGIPPHQDKGAKEYFKKLNEQGYNFKPKRFLDLGYDADGYDEEKHIWYEFDTLYHLSPYQKQKDLIRQTNIIKYFENTDNPLNHFIRVNVDKNGRVLSETYVI